MTMTATPAGSPADSPAETPSDTPIGAAAECGPECEGGSDSASRDRSLALRLVDWYQRTFTGGPPTCRFFPSCSSYAREALEVHGTPRGLWLTARRLLRCRPFGPSGVDPVPEPRAPRSSDSGKVA